MQTNTRLELAHQYIEYTNKNVFLTGKAGTGKTTFLKNLKNHSSKRIAVVAPTGVAAINAGGVTIHSMFQLSFAPFIPGQINRSEQYKFTKEKIRTLRGLDLLVIDEISMVRADVLDAIDAVLKKYRNRFKPFGGLQLLMIGDLHQLAPVVKEDEWQSMKEYYPSMYFFESIALKQSNFITIELTHIYRQSDQTFIALLNKVRDKVLDYAGVELLNSRYQANLDDEQTKGYIHLTTHNYTAQALNKNRLDQLKGKSYKFKAEIIGEFPEQSYPNDYELELKIGAQIMFVRNDLKDKLYFNGKLGVITDIDTENKLIKVRGTGDTHDIYVSSIGWENIKYVLNENKEMTEEVIGKFNQYPIKTAWAITIHKSQGLTFERAIIDAQSSFAHGQVYVALSRCKTLEGLILSSPINTSSIKSDNTITSFHEVAKQYELNDEGLKSAKRQSQIDWLSEIFDFKSIGNSMNRLINAIENDHTKLRDGVRLTIQDINLSISNDIEFVAEKFKNQLPSYFTVPTLPEENESLQERIKKGSAYFVEKIKPTLERLKTLNLECDNKELAKSLQDMRLFSMKLLLEKLKIMESMVANGFNAVKYIQTKANASIDIEKEEVEIKQKKKKSPKATTTGVTYESTHDNKNLYDIIKEWRDEEADRNGLNRYQVIPQKTIQELSEKLPADAQALKHIHGMGDVRIEQYGTVLLHIIKEYCDANNLKAKEDIEIKQPKVAKQPPTGETIDLSYKLIKEGLSIPEVARHRSLSVGTIETHMIPFLKSGALEIRKLIPEEKVEFIQKYLLNHSNQRLKEIKEGIGEEYTYGEIKLVLASLGL